MSRIQLPEFRIRCSQISAIMTGARDKEKAEANFGLGDTTIGYLRKWALDNLTGKKTEFSTKYTRKGLLVEDEAIRFASKVLGWGLVFKNTERRYNEYVEGECDVALGRAIADLKSSWSQATFPLFETQLPTKGYNDQLQGYMWLWDKPKGMVVYTLQDAPDEVVLSEAWSKARELKIELTEELLEVTREKLTFSHLPTWMRIKVFEVIRNDDRIAKIADQVTRCRQYINAVIIPELEAHCRKYGGIEQVVNNYEAEAII